MLRLLAFLMLPFALAAATPAAAAPFKSDRIAVEVKGKGPDVVLIPGLSSSPRVWDTTVAALPGYRYHLVHVAGFDGLASGANAKGAVVAPVAEEIARYVSQTHLKKPAIVGHSLGGAASFEACRQDSHCATAVDLDGTLWTDVRHTGLQVPSLILRHPNATCDAFCEAANTDFAQVKATGTRLLTLQGSEHLNFSDSSVLFEPALHPLGYLGPIDGARAILITRDVLRSFLDAPMRGAPAAAFESTVGRYSELR